MDTLRAYFSAAYWKYGFSVTKSIAALLSSFGMLWLLVEVVTFFSPTTATPLKNMWWLFLALGLVWAMWINRPIHEISCTLAGRDIHLRIRVCNFFEVEGAEIIGSNTTFDTEMASGLINKGSIQGQFTERNYTSTAHLDLDVTSALTGMSHQPAPPGKKGKQNVFPIGTVAKVTPKGKTAYLLAIASLNVNGVANGNFEDLKTALPALWEFISTAGTIEPLVVPVLGSGFSRLPEKKEEIVREIINSFVAACAARRFTDSLTIVIRPRDFYKSAVNLSELRDYLRHVCKYTQVGLKLQQGIGVAVG